MYKYFSNQMFYLKKCHSTNHCCTVEINTSYVYIYTYAIRTLELSKLDSKPRSPEQLFQEDCSICWLWLPCSCWSWHEWALNSCCVNEWLNDFRFYHLAFRHYPSQGVQFGGKHLGYRSRQIPTLLTNLGPWASYLISLSLDVFISPCRITLKIKMDNGYKGFNIVFGT